MEQYTNVRIETMSLEKMKNEIKHELRMTNIKSVVNQKDNYIIVNGKIQTYKTKNKNVIELLILRNQLVQTTN